MFSNTSNNSLPFSEADLRRALTSAEGQRLLAILRAGGADALAKATQAVKRGDYSDAQSLLEPMLRDPEARSLLEKLKSGQS